MKYANVLLFVLAISIQPAVAMMSEPLMNSFEAHILPHSPAETTADKSSEMTVASDTVTCTQHICGLK